jgi:hypothetical protein
MLYISPVSQTDKDDAFGQGLLLGQIMTHCEHILAGGKLAAQIGCPTNYVQFVKEAIEKEGCLALIDGEPGPGRVAVWMYKREIAGILIQFLQQCESDPASQFVAGKLFGYSDHEIDHFLLSQELPKDLRAVSVSAPNQHCG